MIRDESRKRNVFILNEYELGTPSEGFCVKNTKVPQISIYGYGKYSLLIDGVSRLVHAGETVFSKYATLILKTSRGKTITQHSFDLANKKVYIHLDSFCLGDVIAWMPFVQDFYKKHKPARLYVSTWFPEIFGYRDITYISPYQQVVGDIYAFYEFGYNKDSISHRKQPLARLCADELGVPYSEKKPAINTSDLKRNFAEKYVCIAPESKKPIAQWRYPNGWQEIVDFLNKAGYKVVNISAENTIGLKNCVEKDGFTDIMDRINDIYFSDFFIGVSSGLSWLAWALEKEVVMISGFTMPFNEFKCRRVINEDVCNGCWNKTVAQGQCPCLKDTLSQWECSKSITPEMVIKEIKWIM